MCTLICSCQVILHISRFRQREAHSHGVYQYFIREVENPEFIITYNSQTKTGEKWTTTSRGVITKQRKFVPHNQNKNMGERKIQVVKHKTVNVLDHSYTSLESWCYALIFMIDCLNYSAKKLLGWKKSSELLNGDTPDIFASKFEFENQLNTLIQ